MSVTSPGVLPAGEAVAIERAQHWILVRRFALAGCGLAGLGAMAGMFALSPPAGSGSGGSFGFGLCVFLGLMVVPVVAAGLAYFQMRALNRPAAAGVLGSFLLPWVVPFVLACLGEQRAAPRASSRARRRITISGTVLTARTGTFTRVSLSLDSLRLLTIRMPESSTWRGLWSTSEHSSMFPDLLDDGAYAELTKGLDNPLDLTHEVVNGRRYTERERLDALSSIEVLMEDHEGRHVTLDLGQIDGSGCGLFAVLAECRAQRRERFHAWVASEPTVDLRGRFWGSVQLSLAGFRRGKRLTPWNEFGQVYSETSGGSASLYVLPRGVSSGLLSFAKFRHRLLVRTSDMSRYGAWCHLFARLAATAHPGSAETPAEGGADFASLMAGKTVCTGCQTFHTTAEEAASCCGATTLGFMAASRSARCSQCGAHFSDGAVDAQDTLEQTIRAKGLGCPSCGTLFCYGCAPKDGGEGFDAACTCGTRLCVRV
jgi:hypothetical protein